MEDHFAGLVSFAAQDTVACVVSALVMEFATAETRQPQYLPRPRLKGTAECPGADENSLLSHKRTAAQLLVQQSDRRSWIGTAVSRGQVWIDSPLQPGQSGLTSHGSPVGLD